MPTLALLTAHDLPELDRGELLVVPELNKLGIDALPVPWDGDDWRTCDALIVRTIWDYHYRHREFRLFLSEVETSGIPIFNPVPILRWNSDKSYLNELANKGVRIPEQVQLNSARDLDLRNIIHTRNWQEAVIKPVVSASAKSTYRVTSANASEIEANFHDNDHGQLLVQEFLPEILTDGELSIIFLAGAYSHTVRKTPAPGDFRIQEKHGGAYAPVQLPDTLIEQARTILNKIPFDDELLYARVDAIVRDDELVLCELELLEPELFLDWHDDAPAAFARAIQSLLFPPCTGG